MTGGGSREEGKVIDMETETCTCACWACQQCDWDECVCGARVPAGDTGLCVLCEDSGPLVDDEGVRA